MKDQIFRKFSNPLLFPDYNMPPQLGGVLQHAAQRVRFEAFLRKSVKTGFYSENSPSFASICDVADDNYLHSVEMNKDHILHRLLPPKVVQQYDMRRRKHNYRLPDKINNLHESNFFIRMFYNKSSSPKPLTE